MMVLIARLIDFSIAQNKRDNQDWIDPLTTIGYFRISNGVCGILTKAHIF